MEQINADAGQFISLEDARELKKNYEEQPPQKGISAHFIGKNKLQQVLNQNNAVGVRVYYGMKEVTSGNFTQEVVFVGVNANNEDILDTDLILDFSMPCPQWCPKEEKGL